MRLILVVAAIEPAATGLLLIINPVLFGRLILGAELSEPGQALGRLAGIALVSLGLACWPVPPSYAASAIGALLIYNLLATLYLLHLGIGGRLVGMLLWPAVALHTILAMLIVRAWLVVA